VARAHVEAGVIELHVFQGSADDREIDWIVELYGAVDRKYANRWFVRHQFVTNAVGWSLHAFAVADGRAVGHCALLPVPARLGEERIVSGKFEAFAVDQAYQSATLPDGRMVGLALIAELYSRAPSAGFALLHDLVEPSIGLMHRMHSASRVPVSWETYVAVGDRRALTSLGPGWAIAGRGVAWGQEMLRLAAPLLAGRALVREARIADEPPRIQGSRSSSSWTIEADDIWDWLVGTGLLAWVEEPSGGRALFRVPGPAAQAAELLNWCPGRRPLAGAVAAISAVAKVGREGRSIRICNSAGDPDLRRAARLLGLLRARDQLTLYVKGLRPDLDATDVAVNPFFFATF